MHRLLAHTADLRAELVAPDFAALCDEAVLLVRELLVGTSPVAPRQQRCIPLLGDDDAERFFRFVRELLYLADADGFLPAACTLGEREVTVAGEPFDPARHVAERQVKALTRHQYVFEPAAGGLRAELIFDL